MVVAALRSPAPEAQPAHDRLFPGRLSDDALDPRATAATAAEPTHLLKCVNQRKQARKRAHTHVHAKTHAHAARDARTRILQCKTRKCSQGGLQATCEWDERGNCIT